MPVRSSAIEPEASIKIRTSSAGIGGGKTYLAQLCPPPTPVTHGDPPDDPDDPPDDPPGAPPDDPTEGAPPGPPEPASFVVKGGRVEATVAVNTDASEIP